MLYFNKMKKIFFLSFIGIVLLAFPAVTLGLPEAPDCDTYCNDPSSWDPPSGKLCLCSPIHSRTIEELLENLINYIFWFATAIVPIMIIVGGFLFITAGGDVNKIEQAKRLITYTALGYGIVLFSKGLVYALKSILGG